METMDNKQKLISEILTVNDKSNQIILQDNPSFFYRVNTKFKESDNLKNNLETMDIKQLKNYLVATKETHKIITNKEGRGSD